MSPAASVIFSDMEYIFQELEGNPWNRTDYCFKKILACEQTPGEDGKIWRAKRAERGETEEFSE